MTVSAGARINEPIDDDVLPDKCWAFRPSHGGTVARR